jgi:hypothetical protein
MSEYNNNVPNPDWYVRGESETLPDKEILATLDEAKRRLLRDQAIGLRNLRDKRFYLEYPNNTIYDIVNTIGLIPVTNGQAVRLPKTEASIRTLPMSGAGRCWVTSLPFTLATGAGVRNHPMGSLKDAHAPRCSSAFRIIGAGATETISFSTNVGDTLICAVWYSFIDSTPSNEFPFEISEDWGEPTKSDGATSNNGTFWTNCYFKIATEETSTVTITNTKDREIVIGLFDYWGYNYIPFIDTKKMIAGPGNKNISKEDNNDCLWVLRSAISHNSGFIVYPNTVKKVRFFEPNRTQYEFYLDTDEKGDRTISYGDINASTGVFSIVFKKEESNKILNKKEEE